MKERYREIDEGRNAAWHDRERRPERAFGCRIVATVEVVEPTEEMPLGALGIYVVRQHPRTMPRRIFRRPAARNRAPAQLWAGQTSSVANSSRTSSKVNGFGSTGVSARSGGSRSFP